MRGKKSLGTVFKKMYGRLKTKSHKSASHVCEGSSVHGNRKSVSLCVCVCDQQWLAVRWSRSSSGVCRLQVLRCTCCWQPVIVQLASAALQRRLSAAMKHGCLHFKQKLIYAAEDQVHSGNVNLKAGVDVWLILLSDLILLSSDDFLGWFCFRNKIPHFLFSLHCCLLHGEVTG